MGSIEKKFRWITTIALLCCLVAIAAEEKTDAAEEISDNPVKFGYADLIQPLPATADQQQRNIFATLTEALASGLFSEAEIAAKRMVVQANANEADEPLARARALHNLAVVQQFRGSSEAALQNYATALSLIVSSEDNLNAALIMPLRGLASTHLGLGQTYEAFQSFDRALHVSSVNYGPHSLKQLPILNSKLQVYLKQNDNAAALKMLDRIYLLHSHTFPLKSQEMLPFYRQQAEIYEALKMDAVAYKSWQRILRIKQAHYDKHDLALVEPHHRLAEISIRDMRQDTLRSVVNSKAEKYLKKALWIAENSPQNDWQTKKDCLLALADFYTLFNMQRRAHRYYADAWSLLSSNEDYQAARAVDLETPVPLAQLAPDPYANFAYVSKRGPIDPNDYIEGEMVMSFTVNERGRTKDILLVAADPANFSHMERRVRNSVEKFIYRPRYVDGKATATGNQQYRVKYHYLLSEYQTSLEKSAKRGRR